MTNLLFEPPFGGLRGNVRTLSIARWKACSRLPIRDNWTFFASSYDWYVISRYWSKSALFRGGGSLWAQILGGKGRHPPTVVGIRKLECSLLPSVKISLGAIPACDWQTDGRVELPWLIQRSSLQAMLPRCKSHFDLFLHGLMVSEWLLTWIWVEMLGTLD